MSEPLGGLYKVVFSGQQREQLRRWGHAAVRLGLGEQYLAALKEIDEQLRKDPVSWGNPLRQLREGGLLLCHRACSPLHVSFAVDEERQIVYVKEIRTLSRRLSEEGDQNV
jgi:hypothetical protein